MDKKELQARAIALAIRCFGANAKKSDKPGSALKTALGGNLHEWLMYKDICEAVNTLSYELDFLSDKSDKEFVNRLPYEKIGDGVIPRVLRRFLGNLVVMVFSGLPVAYVRWKGCIILRDTKDMDACLDSIREGMAEYKAISGQIEEIMKSHDSPVDYSDRRLTTIRKQCTLMVGLSSSERAEFKDNYFWRELLQNANDHIIPGSDMVITVNSDSIVLEYSEAGGGFAVRDFAAICVDGNSGSARNKDLKTGNKGTGFKSVYNFFDTVIIESNGVCCKLIDKPITMLSECGENEYGDKWDAHEKKYYPVPEFSTSRLGAGKTRIELFFKKNFGSHDCREDALNHICGKDSVFSGFVAKKDYLFLDNIGRFVIDNTVFNRREYLDENYIRKTEAIFLDLNELPENHPCRFTGENAMEKLKAANELTVLFPKPKNLDDEIKSGNKPVYCALPVEHKTLSPSFYVNIPMLELEDSRNSFSEDNDGGWNRTVMDKAIRSSDSALFRILSGMNGEYPDKSADETIDLRNLYRYVVPICQSDASRDALRIVVQQLPFVRSTVDGKQFEPRKPDETGFLPEYMYARLLKRWRDKNYHDFDGFVSGGTNDKPFAFYDEELSHWNYRNTVVYRICEYYESIRNYISNKAGEDTDFDEWLKSALGDFGKYNDGTKIIVSAYLRDKISEDNQYHNINIENPTVKTYMENEGYISVNDIDERTKEFFCRNMHDEVICCMKSRGISILENPYDTEDGRKIVKLLIKSGEYPLLVDYSWKYICNKTKEELVSMLETGLLYGEAACKKTVCLTQNCYAVVSDDSVAVDHDRILKAKYNVRFRSVTALGKNLFNEEPDFVDKVIGAYWESYSDDARGWIEEYKGPKYDKVALLVLKKLISSGNSIRWKPEFGGLLNEMEQKDLFPNDANESDFNNHAAIFRFSDGQLAPLPFDIRDRFDRMVSSSAKDALTKKTSGDILKRTFICRIRGNKRLFCMGEFEKETQFILFREEAFGTMLRALGCTEFSTDISYKRMRETVIPNGRADELYKNYGDTKQMHECVRKRVNEYFSSDSDIADHTIYDENIFMQFWEISLKSEKSKRPIRFNVAGYNLVDRDFDDENSERAFAVCPVCGGKLFAEASLLKVGYVCYVITSDKSDASDVPTTKRLHLPVPMCRNCRESLSYADMISFDDKDGLHLDKLSPQPIELTLHMNGENARSITASLSAFNRWLWDLIIKTQTGVIPAAESTDDSSGALVSAQV